MTHPNYPFKHCIGGGGMAKVYLAEHKALHLQVTIQVLNNEFVHNDNIRKIFLAEARYQNLKEPFRKQFPNGMWRNYLCLD